MKESFRRSTGESTPTRSRASISSLRCRLAFGVVYTSSRISFSERSRDLATLRITGFTHREVANVLIAEHALLLAIAFADWTVVGGQFADLTIQAASTESARLPLVLSAETYSTACFVVLISAGISLAIVSKGIRNLDLPAVLRTSE